VSMGLTKRRSECLAVLTKAVEGTGIMPSFQQIADALGVKSKSSVYRLVDGLEQRGAICRLHGQSRSVQIIQPDSITLNPEIARLVRSYAEQEGIKTDTAVNALLRDALGAAA
jgi:repressor LexA